MFETLFSLSGQRALITGASSGLGREFASILALAGAEVILAARNEKRLQKATQAISKQGGKACYFVFDLLESSSITALGQFALKQGDVHILINCAGMSGLTPVAEQNNEKFAQIFQVNVHGPWLLTQIIAKAMMTESIQGSIINIASINGDNVPYPGASAYCGSKAAVIQMTKALSNELASYRIRVNCIAPGLFRTAMTEKAIQAKEADFNQLIPLGFVAKASDLRAAILFLSSNNASGYMTGSCLTIDGGLSAHCLAV